MRYLPGIALILTVLAGLAATNPLHEVNVPQQASQNTTIVEKRVVKTTAANHFCSDKNWKPFGERAFLAGIRLMGRVDDTEMGLSSRARKQIPDTYLGKQGMCVNLWCGGDHKKGRAVVFLLCLHAETPDKLYNSGDLAKSFHDGFYDCNSDREPQDDADNTPQAFHIWENGYDLHVEGGYDGMKCPGDTKKVRWARPVTLDESPYKEAKPA